MTARRTKFTATLQVNDVEVKTWDFFAATIDSAKTQAVKLYKQKLSKKYTHPDKRILTVTDGTIAATRDMAYKAWTNKEEAPTMKKQHNIINANDIHAALKGEQVEPMKKTRKTASKAAHKRAAEICKQLCFCFTVKPEPVYFKDINDLQELKAKHLELAKKHHPDNGGDAATMAKINAEYDEKVKELAASAEKPRNGYTDKAENMTDEEIAAAIAEEFKATLEKLMTLDLEGVKVELIGSWLWVSGNTKPIKDELKALKFRWCPKKDGQPWTWHDSFTYYPSSKGRMSKEDVENKYGVEELKSA